MSVALAKSGMFKDVTQAEQAFGRILLGADLGLTPTQALMSVDVVRGNVQVRSVRLAAWVRQHPDYDYKVVEHDDQHCVIDFYYKGEIEGTSAFSVEDAKAAKALYKDGPWKTHPRNMVFARAMSNGVKWYCPDLTGGIPVYTEADTFGPQDITDTEAESAPVTLLPAVEEVVTRAETLGHAALSNRDAAAMATNGQPEEAVQAWVARATETLDPAPQEEVPDAEVVEETLDA
jgi:hypothetical protein